MAHPNDNLAADLGKQFMNVNPHLAQGRSAQSGADGGTATCGDNLKAVRVIQSGGDFANALRHPIFTPLEQLWRKMPDDGIFQAAPNRPSIIEIGAFRVPKNQTFILGEYSMQPFRFNGAIANDIVPLEQQRLPTSLGYDLNFSQFRKGNLSFEIVPTAAPKNSRAAFMDPNPFEAFFQGTDAEFEAGPIEGLYTEPPAVPDAPDAMFNKAQSSALGNPAGSALLPPSERIGQGPEKFPFTFMVNENDVVQIRAYIFHPISVPIAFFQASISGYLVSTQRLQLLLKGVAPCW